VQAVVEQQLLPRFSVRAKHLRRDVHETEVAVGGAVLADKRVGAGDLLDPTACDDGTPCSAKAAKRASRTAPRRTPRNVMLVIHVFYVLARVPVKGISSRRTVLAGYRFAGNLALYAGASLMQAGWPCSSSS
jgi:hypothetical protein